MSTSFLSDDDLQRYGRHLSLEGFGEEGQRRLNEFKVLVIGAGGLGSPIASYLCAAGVGTLTIVDGDRVELSNLQRQLLHHTADVGAPKVESAAEKLHALNPKVTIQIIQKRLTEDNGVELITGHHFVVDATDNESAKFLINDLCQQLKIPYSHGGIDRWRGQTISVNPGKSTCLRCLFDSSIAPGPKKSPSGPIGALPGVIGSIQALEAIKIALQTGEPLFNRLFMFDALTMTARTIPMKINPECSCQKV